MTTASLREPPEVDEPTAPIRIECPTDPPILTLTAASVLLKILRDVAQRRA